MSSSTPKSPDDQPEAPQPPESSADSTLSDRQAQIGRDWEDVFRLAQPHGLWQDIPMPTPDYDHLRAEFAALPIEAKLAAAQAYLVKRYHKDMTEAELTEAERVARMLSYPHPLIAGPPQYPPPGTYDQMISRNDDGSDPLVPEPGP